MAARRSVPLLVLSALLILIGFGASPTLAKETQELNQLDYLPVVIPLATRSPYLGAYLQESSSKNLARQSPRFWTNKPLGWQGLLRVDGSTWNWMGNVTDWPPTVNASVETDSASSTFVMTDDPPTIQLTATFLSPVTPDDLFRQSLPFSYLTLEVAVLDNKEHQIEVYSEINGLWLADDEAEQLEWALEDRHKNWKGMSLRLKDQREFEEENGYAEHGNERILHGDVWYAARTGDNVESTLSVGADAVETRRQFSERGKLGDSLNSTYRSTRQRSESDQKRILDEPAFAVAHSFGTVTPYTSRRDSTSLVVVGHVRDPIVRLRTDGKDNEYHLRPLWTSTFADAQEMLSFFVSDYEHIKEMSSAFNDKLYADARRVQDQEYGHTVAVPTRQIFAAMEAAVDYRLDEKSSRVTYSPITKKPIPTLMMLKEVSSNGNAQTVDVIAPFLPFMIYASPQMMPLLLEPLYRYSAAGTWQNLPPCHDLGDHYPSYHGHDDYQSPSLPIEEAGNMLGMALAGVLRGDKASKEQAERYYDLLKQWADYLVDHALFPEMQLSTDDFAGMHANSTSLVIKGVVGIRAMAEIALESGRKDDYEHYLALATTMMNTFLSLAVSADDRHLMGHYGNDSSWHSQYNLYYDRLCGTNLFPKEVYDRETAFLPTVAEDYGPPLDSADPARAKIDWLAWLAAIATTNTTRHMLINSVSRYYRQNLNWERGDLIYVRGGWSVGFETRPVEGGLYSLLAVDLMDRILAARGSWHHRVVDRVKSLGMSWSTLLSWAVGLLLLGAALSFVSRQWQAKRLASRGSKYGPLDDLGGSGGSRGQRGDESPLLDRRRLSSWSASTSDLVGGVGGDSGEPQRYKDATDGDDGARRRLSIGSR